MTVSERTIYIGVIFLAFTLSSSDLLIGSILFTIVLGTALGTTFAIRDAAKKFDFDFSGFFSVFTVATIIYAIIAKFGSTDLSQPIVLLLGILVVTNTAHFIHCSENTNNSFWDISDIPSDDEDEDEDDESVEAQTEEYTSGGDGTEAESDADSDKEKENDAESDVESDKVDKNDAESDGESDDTNKDGEVAAEPDQGTSTGEN